MKLVLVRHAAALDRNNSVADDYRYLTPEGRAFFRRTAKTIKKIGLQPDMVLTSPLVRAVQTADILAESLRHDGPVVVRDELKQNFDLPTLQQLLNEFRNARQLVLVGHDPDFSSLISTFLTLEGVKLKKGAAVLFKVDPDSLLSSAKFKWMAVGKNRLTKVDDNLISMRHGLIG